jgi:hypothetical protein
MSVNFILAIIEYFVVKLQAAAEKHLAKVKDLNERIDILKHERAVNEQEAKRASGLANKIAEFIS